MSPAGKGIPGLSGIDHVSLTVPDMEAATRFYCDVIGGELMWELGPFDAREMPACADGRDWTAGHVDVPDARLLIRMVRVHNIAIELFEFTRPERELAGPARGQELGPHHIGFQVTDIAAATQYLRDQGVTVLEGPIEIPEDAPGGAAYHQYFEDPWGNQLEITQRAHPLLG